MNKKIILFLSLGIFKTCYASAPIKFNGEDVIFDGDSHTISFAIKDSSAFLWINEKNIKLASGPLDESKVAVFFQETKDIITKHQDVLESTVGDLYFIGGRSAGPLEIGGVEANAAKSIIFDVGPVKTQQSIFTAREHIKITTSNMNFDRTFFNTGGKITFNIPEEYRTWLSSISWDCSEEGRDDRKYDILFDGFFDFKNISTTKFMAHHASVVTFNLLKES